MTGDGSHSATAGNVDAAAVRPAEQLAEYARKIRFFESLLMDRSFTLAVRWGGEEGWHEWASM